MGKSKDAPALFEILQRQGGVKAFKTPVPEALKSDEPVVEAAPQAADVVIEPPQPKVAVDAAPAQHGEAVVRTEGERVRFSLSTLALATVIFVAGISMLASFGVGWQMGSDRARRQARLSMLANLADESILAALDQPASPEVMTELDAVDRELQIQAARDSRAAMGDQTGWIKGLNYVWIETFITHDDAIRAREYLVANDIDSMAIEKSGKWRLYTLQGFDYRIPEEKAECEDLVSRIKQIGQAYLKAGGRYRFDCQPMKLTRDRW